MISKEKYMVEYANNVVANTKNLHIPLTNEYIKNITIEELCFVLHPNRELPIKEKLWRKLLKDTKGFCPDCKKFVGFSRLTRDHIIPQVVGGRDVIENLQPLCLPCNIKKGIKIIDINKVRDIINKVGFKDERSKR